MNFTVPAEHDQIRDAIEKICAPFDADFWLRKDLDACGAPGRPLRRPWPEGLDQHGAGDQQNPAAGAHHAGGGVHKGPEGLSLFYTDPDRSTIEVREIEKRGRKCVDSNQVFIDGLRIPLEDRIGEEGKGFSYTCMG